MKVAVVGASGRTGLRVVEQASARADEVTAVVRNPQKLLSSWTGGEPPRVSRADALDAVALARAFEGQDAVVFCLGNDRGGDHTIHREAVRTCLDAMEQAGVTRIVALSASGMVTQGDDPLSRFVAKPVVGRVLAGNFADLLAMEDVLARSSAAWTVVRPPRLTNGAGTGRYRQRRDGNVRWRFTISRADLALAMVDAVHDDSSIETYISVAG
jgi:putative NADH-flavin reductase